MCLSEKIELGVPFILLILLASSHKYLLYDIHKRGIVSTGTIEVVSLQLKCSAERLSEFPEPGGVGRFPAGFSMEEQRERFPLLF